MRSSILLATPLVRAQAPHLYLESDRLCDRFKAKAMSSTADLCSLQEEPVPGEKYAQVLKPPFFPRR